MTKVKSMFQKSCSIAVIIYFLYHIFLTKIGIEMIYIYQKFVRSIWIIIKRNDISILTFFVLICLFAVFLALWIVGNDKQEKGIKEETKQKTGG